LSAGGRFSQDRPRHRTIQHQSFDDYSTIADAFAGVDACLYCLGKWSTQVAGEPEYRRLTYDYALAAARPCGAADAAFQFISGASTRIDSRYMWARVKAETERDLLADGHPANCWRPASIDGVPSASEPVLFRVARPAMRLLRPFRSLYVRAEDIGLAMLAATGQGIRGRIFENAEIRDLADRARTPSQPEIRDEIVKSRPGPPIVWVARPARARLESRVCRTCRSGRYARPSDFQGPRRPHLRSSVAQRQSIRLLTGGLLVRIQPEEPISPPARLGSSGCLLNHWTSGSLREPRSKDANPGNLALAASRLGSRTRSQSRLRRDWAHRAVF
jgi:uncharacterized protein YbjT (DUF2867 family)